MVAAVESMAYAGEVPWHGLGNPVSNKLKPAQMLKAASCDWGVAKESMFLKSGAVVPQKFALVRDSDQSVLSVVGSTYKPVQNADAFEFFTKFANAGKMTMETAGSLWGGRYVWALARITASDFDVAKSKDEVRGYVLMMSPHVHGKAMVFQATGIRVVCWNTLNLALGAGLRGKQHAFRSLHSREFNEDVKELAASALGLAKDRMSEYKDAAVRLASKKAKPAQIEQYFFDVLRYDPSKAKTKKDGDAKQPRMLPKLQEALTHAPGQDLSTAKGTWWGALNAVTYVVDHEMGRDRDTALKNAWVGNMANVKRRALDLAIKAAG